MKRYLVTGASGFLGSHLCARLLADGHAVIGMDNNQTGRMENLHGLDQNFEFIEHDVTQPFLDLEVDGIYNLACPASPPHYQADAIGTLRTSVWGTYNGLELAKKLGVRFFQASTSEVYGDPEVHPQPESYRGCVNPIGTRACYDEGKRAAESLCFDFLRQHNVDIRVVRIFNTYGPNMDPKDGRVVSNFIMQALQGQPITIYGDGNQTRSFCFVEDLIEGFVRMMSNGEQFHGPVNLGNPGEFTVKELAQQVIALTGSVSEIIYQDLPLDDPKQRRPEISLAKEKLGWEPQISLEDGLKRTIPYFQSCIES